MAKSKNPKYITEYQNLMNEWDWNANNLLGYLPDKITIGSNIIARWICSKCGHKWAAKIEKRVNGSICPICRRKLQSLPQAGESLAECNPKLAKEWNSNKNGGLTPYMVSRFSHKKVWWQCALGHEWQAIISSRTRGNGCPICSKELQTSYPEQVVFFYIKQLFPDAINRYNETKHEIDIYIPSIKIGIEYDGCRFHTNDTRQKEIRKEKFFENLGISILRIKERKNLEVSSCQEQNIFYYRLTHNYEYIKDVLLLVVKAIFEALHQTAPDLDISLERDNQAILESYVSNIKENSIQKNALLLQEWNFERNKQLRPEFISVNSGKTVWWRCKQGHEWQAKVSVRNRGNGCPYCSHQKILVGYNDLATTNPSLAAEWHPSKNGAITPNQVIAGSTKKFWWRCKQGHEWQASLCSRNKGIGCPYCTNQAVLVGYNDLQSVNPTLASEWHPAKNGVLTPNMVSYGSGKKVWWRCKLGHEWQAYINHRSNGIGCPICATLNKVGKGTKRINVYIAADLSYYATFNGAKDLCKHLGLDYDKQFGNIASVCRRKQKTLLGKFILRYDTDDELKKNN